MDDFDPTGIFKRNYASNGRRQFECPDDQVLTAALEGEFRDIEMAAFEGHVSGCDYCLDRLGSFARLNRIRPEMDVPDLTLARAQRMIRSPSGRLRLPVRSAAAIVGFTAILTALWMTQFPRDSNSPVLHAPEVRNIDPDAIGPQVVLPEDGASLTLSHPLFRWRPVPGTLHYDVRIVSEDGTLIWQERVQNPTWQLPRHLRLAAGEDYYFRVDAYLTQAKSLSSKHVMFRVERDD